MRVRRPREDERTCPKSHSSYTVELELESGGLNSEPTLPHRCQEAKAPSGCTVHRRLSFLCSVMTCLEHCSSQALQCIRVTRSSVKMHMAGTHSLSFWFSRSVKEPLNRPF